MLKGLTGVIAALAALGLVLGCAPPPSSSDIQRDRQERAVQEGVAEAGIPAMTNFRELKLAKELYELRAQTGLLPYSYLENLVPTVVPGKTALGGKLTFLCGSIGYPLPYSVQFTGPESVQTYYLDPPDSQSYYGV